MAFAGFAEIIVPPTNDRNVLLQALGNLTTSFGTAIGSAMLKSIDAIAMVNPTVAASGLNLGLEEGQAQPPFQPDIIVQQSRAAARGRRPAGRRPRPACLSYRLWYQRSAGIGLQPGPIGQ